METISDNKVLGELDSYDAQLEMTNDLLSIVVDKLLNFNHIDPYSDDPNEKRNVQAFCSNFKKICTLMLFSQQEINDVRGQVRKLMEEARNKPQEESEKPVA